MTIQKKNGSRPVSIMVQTMVVLTIMAADGRVSATESSGGDQYTLQYPLNKRTNAEDPNGGFTAMQMETGTSHLARQHLLIESDDDMGDILQNQEENNNLQELTDRAIKHDNMVDFINIDGESLLHLKKNIRKKFKNGSEDNKKCILNGLLGGDVLTKDLLQVDCLMQLTLDDGINLDRYHLELKKLNFDQFLNYFQPVNRYAAANLAQKTLEKSEFFVYQRHGDVSENYSDDIRNSRKLQIFNAITDKNLNINEPNINMNYLSEFPVGMQEAVREILIDNLFEEINRLRKEFNSSIVQNNFNLKEIISNLEKIYTKDSVRSVVENILKSLKVSDLSEDNLDVVFEVVLEKIEDPDFLKITSDCFELDNNNLKVGLTQFAEDVLKGPQQAVVQNNAAAPAIYHNTIYTNPTVNMTDAQYNGILATADKNPNAGQPPAQVDQQGGQKAAQPPAQVDQQGGQKPAQPPAQVDQQGGQQAVPKKTISEVFAAVKAVYPQIKNKGSLNLYNRLDGFLKKAGIKAGMNVAKRVKSASEYASKHPNWLAALRVWNDYLVQQLADLKGQKPTPKTEKAIKNLNEMIKLAKPILDKMGNVPVVAEPKEVKGVARPAKLTPKQRRDAEKQRRAAENKKKRLKEANAKKQKQANAAEKRKEAEAAKGEAVAAAAKLKAAMEKTHDPSQGALLPKIKEIKDLELKSAAAEAAAKRKEKEAVAAEKAAGIKAPAAVKPKGKAEQAVLVPIALQAPAAVKPEGRAAAVTKAPAAAVKKALVPIALQAPAAVKPEGRAAAGA